ncbi:MAG: NAD(P)-binding domain-containing protein [Nocardioides sp.]|uniref:NAD(P)-binding domain-containing protein n=1 Tax=Nocardioides sp. TaxID=35761 RepID=UPI0039E5E70D
MEILDSLVIGAGQAGLSASYHLSRRGIDHVVLDANRAPGGAWRHRWDSLTMADVHGVASLPDAEPPSGSGRANEVVPAYFAAYERSKDLPVVRPVRVDRVESVDGLLVTHAGERTWTSRTLVNATGTWTQPHLPSYPGIADFAGEQWHTQDYPGADHFRGRRTLVVGGGASAVQLLGEIALVTDVLWATRRPPVWRTDEFTPEAGHDAVALVEERVRRGLPPASVVSVTGLMLRPQEEAARRLGVYDRRLPMFTRIEPNGVRWADGRFERVDAIVWATGFRPAITHLAPLHLRGPAGGVQLDRHGTTAVADPRVQLTGYGPSASTIGANRAGRAAARGVATWLAAHPSEVLGAPADEAG